MSLPDAIIYKRFGWRLCINCYSKSGALVRVTFDMEDTKALGREVQTCPSYKELSIGEPVPPVLKMFFDLYTEEYDLPDEERVAV